MGVLGHIPSKSLVGSGTCLCIDVKVRRTDAGCELRYLPQATEEDRGAHLFKARAEIGALTFVERRRHLFRRAGGGAPR